MTDGLKDPHREAIIATLAANDRVERAVLFGSRATGTNTVSSDVDIALFGARLTLTDQARLAAQLEEIPMAQSVDLVLHDSVQDRALRDHIRRQGVEWYARTPQHKGSNIASEGGSEWPVVTVENLSEKVAMGPFGSSIKVSTFVPDGVPIISGQHLHGVRVDETPGFNFITHEHAQRLANANVRRGDVVFTHAGNIGQVAYIPECSRFERYVISQRQFYLRCDTSKAIPEFIARYFTSAEGQHQLLANASQVGVPSIAQPVSYLRTLQVPLPPLSEQRTIAHVLGTLDDKIELNRRMNATLEAMARALFRSWFVDFDPVRAKMDGRDTGLPKGIAELFPDRLVDSELGEIPWGWSIGYLSEHFEVIKGVSYKGSGLGRGGTPLHNLNSVDKRGGYRCEGIKFYSGDYADRHVVYPGDVIVANTDLGRENLLIGYSAIVPRLFGDSGIVSHHLYRVRARPSGRLSAVFLYRLLNSPQMHDVVAGYANGTTVTMLPKDALQMPAVVEPPRTLLETFDALALDLEHRREQAVVESRTLGALRDALLPRLVSGELRVTGLEPASARDDHSAPVGMHGA